MIALATLCMSLARSPEDLARWGAENRDALQAHPTTTDVNRAAFAARMADLKQGSVR